MVWKSLKVTLVSISSASHSICQRKWVRQLCSPLLYYLRTGVSWWSGRSVINKPSERIFFFFFFPFCIMYNLWNLSHRNHKEQSLMGIQMLLHTFIDGETIHGYFRENDCISHHQLLTYSAGGYTMSQLLILCGLCLCPWIAHLALLCVLGSRSGMAKVACRWIVASRWMEL